MEKKKPYAIILPYDIDEEMFEILNYAPGKIRCNLIRDYENINAINTTIATTPKAALSNIIFRELGKGINAKSIVKMLRPEIEKQVFEIPEFDNQNGELTKDQADILRNYELASLIAEKKASTPNKQYFTARDTLKKYYHSLSSFQ